MTRKRKIDILYARACGQNVPLSPAEEKELKKYKVTFNMNPAFTTKKNLGEYVDAIDGGALRISFYDWCMNNNKADRRFRNSSEQDMARDKKFASAAMGYLGCLPWGFALYYILGQHIPVIVCLIVGLIIAVAVYKLARKYYLILNFALPVALGVIIPSAFGYGIAG